MYFIVIDKPVQSSTAETNCVSKVSIHKELDAEKSLDESFSQENNKSSVEIKSVDR